MNDFNVNMEIIKLLNYAGMATWFLTCITYIASIFVKWSSNMNITKEHYSKSIDSINNKRKLITSLNIIISIVSIYIIFIYIIYNKIAIIWHLVVLYFLIPSYFTTLNMIRIDELIINNYKYE